MRMGSPLPIELTPKGFFFFCLFSFCSVLFCSVLFCSVLFCSVLFCSVLFCSVLLFSMHAQSIPRWCSSGMAPYLKNKKKNRKFYTFQRNLMTSQV